MREVCLSFIDNLMDFKSPRKPSYAYVSQCLEKGLTEQGRSALNVSSTILWTGILELKRRQQTKHHLSSLSVS